MWHTPESRFRILLVRRAADGELVASRLFDAEAFAGAEAMEEALGRETVELFRKFGAGHEVFESSCGGPRPLLGEWWRGRPKLRFLIVRRKAGRKDMPVRKFLDASKYRSGEHFDKVLSVEKKRLAEKYPPADWDILEVAAQSMAEFREKNSDLAK